MFINIFSFYKIDKIEYTDNVILENFIGIQKLDRKVETIVTCIFNTNTTETSVHIMYILSP